MLGFTATSKQGATYLRKKRAGVRGEGEMLFSSSNEIF
jgi:hypothetical protein